MDKALLQQIVDGIFQFAEKQLGTGHPLVVAMMEVIRKEVDAVGLDALIAFLKSKGINI